MGELQKRRLVMDQIFQEYDVGMKGELTVYELQSLHESVRLGGISIQQVIASMHYTCAADTCDPSELFEVLQEMDRRYYLLQDFKWEFALLDREQVDTITEDQARFMMESVHGNLFSQRKWEKFLHSRPVPGSRVSLAEIEVDLCNIPSKEDILHEKMEEEREREERIRMVREKKEAEERAKELARKQLEEERKQQQEAIKRQQDEEDRRRKEEEDKKKRERLEFEKLKEEEERGRLEAEERERQRRILQEKERERGIEIEEVQDALEVERELKRRAEALEEQEKQEAERVKNIEEETEEAIKKEKEAEEEAKRAREAALAAKDAAARKQAEEEEKKAKEKARRAKNNRIRKHLKLAIKERDREKIKWSVKEFKLAKLSDDDGDLAKGERILAVHDADEMLRDAMERRSLEDLDKGIAFVKKKGFDVHLPHRMIEANKMLLRLKRLKRLRDEIMNLKQSTVAEIRSYQKPPRVVHQVMIGTYLLLGVKEKETKEWKRMQALVGKTGKEGLKRRVLECDISKVDVNMAKRAKTLLDEFDLDEVRDTSAGAAVFYVWATATVEEVEDREEKKAAGEDVDGPAKDGKREAKTYKHELKTGKLTITI
ncbi:apical junction molecule ajm-1-like [Ptychodera flava]|uniref:apical junction molecule ajm-1-like n=1 Tax=Ptychodera flava TaxID=63121 RepID=UPI003969C199